MLTVVGGDNLSGINGGEYFIDEDPGEGNGIELAPYMDPNTMETEMGADLSPGQYTIYVRTLDFAGNWSAPKSVVLTVADPDTTAPVVTGVPARAPDHNGWYTSNVDIDWQATDANGATDPANVLASLEGEHTYTSAQSCDPTGNCATGSLTLKIDKAAPQQFAILSPANGATVSGVHRFEVEISDPISGIKKILCNIAGHTYVWELGKTNNSLHKGAGNTWYVDVNTANIPDGTNHVVLRATDGAGNTRYWNNRLNLHSFVVDN